MGDFLSNLFSKAADSSADEVLSYTAMASAAASAGAYLAATLQSTTPELRSIMGSFVTQKTMEHEAMTDYVIKKGWMNPYDEPTRQLAISSSQATSMLSQH